MGLIQAQSLRGLHAVLEASQNLPASSPEPVQFVQVQLRRVGRIAEDLAVGAAVEDGVQVLNLHAYSCS